MEIYKVAFTQEEQQEFDSLEDLIQRYLYGPMASAEDPEAMSRFNAAVSRQSKIIDAAENRYMKSITGNYSAIIEIVHEILDAYTKDDYIKFVKPLRVATSDRIKQLESMRDSRTPDQQQKIDKQIADHKKSRAEWFSYTYNSARRRLDNLTALEASALHMGSHPLDEYNKLLDKKAAELYPPTPRKKPDHQSPGDLQSYNDSIVEVQLSMFDENAFLPMLQGTLTTGLMSLASKGLQSDALRGGAAIIRRAGSKGHTITFEKYDTLQGELSVSAKKILDAATVQLTHINPYRPNDPAQVKPTVEIDLLEYARANGYKVDPQPATSIEEMEREQARIADLLKDVKKKVHRDLSFICSITQTWREISGKNKGDYTNIRIISSHSIRRGVIRINFDIDAARYLVNSYIMQYPSALLKHDNRNPNSYAIGRKIAYHNSIDSNIERGTADTLSIIALLEAAPEIQSYDSLIASGNRNWKRLIKSKLEKALDDNITVGLLERWEYRSEKTGPLDKAQASALTWNEYTSLYVDFIVKDAPDQTKRLAANAIKMATHHQTAPKKKRTSQKSATQ